MAMFIDVMFEKFNKVDTSKGIECYIDGQRVLLKKDGGNHKIFPINKSGKSYLSSSKSAKFKLVDALVEENQRILFGNQEFETTYSHIRTMLNNRP